MKILTAKQKAQVDAYTIEHEPIASIDLMERAATACVDWMIKHLNFSSVFVVCGMGNNGGDGLALARLLAKRGLDVGVGIVKHKSSGSVDFITNRARSEELDLEVVEVSDAQLPSYDSYDYVVDALFGSGLNKPLEGMLKDVVNVLNQRPTPVISIDVPSGLPMQTEEAIPEITAVRASIVLSFESPGLNLLLPDYQEYAQHIAVLNIGLDADAIEQADSPYHYIDAPSAQRMYRRRTKYSHKGTHGHALIIAGSFGKMGACVLATQAALRAGTGLATAYIPSRGYEILQSQVPEAMVYCNVGERIYYPSEFETTKTVGIGPGIGTDQPTADFLHDVLKSHVMPMVIDADAINILASNKEWLKLLPPKSILTPHPGELQRLIGPWDNDYEKLQLMRQLCIENHVTMLCKGAHTVTVTPKGKFHFNSTGNPGLATGGAGDVLTGIITGLLAQGYKPKHAALLGVYIHGLSADIAVAGSQSAESLVASDIIAHLGPAFKTLQHDGTAH